MVSLNIDEHKVEDGPRWTAFTGSGVRLSGRPLNVASPLDNGASSSSVIPAAAVDANVPPAALRLPKNKLWFGYEDVPAEQQA